MNRRWDVILFFFEVFNFGHHSSLVSQSRYCCLHFHVEKLRLRKGKWIFQRNTTMAALGLESYFLSSFAALGHSPNLHFYDDFE